MQGERNEISAARLDQLRAVLAAAVQLPQESREDFVRQQCSQDPAVLDESLSLLQLHDSAAQFLNRPLAELYGVSSLLPNELPAGIVIKDRYRIESKISSSDFATVYLAADERLGKKPVVVKVLDRLHDETLLRETFASELHSLSRVHHRNVAGISDAGTLENGTPFLVLNYIPGVTLRELLRRGPVLLPRARAIVLGMARALAAAHRVDVWHLDIKPENVIISEPDAGEERVTVIDFGIARLKSLPASSLVAGSPRYMAPEQHDAPSSKCDIYSLALVAFELFTGHTPSNPHGIERQLPAALGRRTVLAIAKGLQPEPAGRFSDVSDFIEEMRAEHALRAKAAQIAWAALGGTVAVALATYLWFIRTHVDSEYSKPVPIVATPAVEEQPAFSPDGTQIYYSAGPLGSQDIYRRSISGGDPILVVGSPDNDCKPTVSPDGSRLMFFRWAEKRLEVVQKRLPDGPEEILANGVDLDSYSWTPDGKRIVLSATVAGGMQKLLMLEIDSRKLEFLVMKDAPNCGMFHPTVAPNSRVMSFSCRWARGSDELMVAEVTPDLKNVGPPRRITKRRERIVSVAWAPDSQSLLCVAGPLGNGSVWRAHLSGPDPVQVGSIPERIESVAIPLKSWKIAYSRNLSDSNLWLYAPETGGLPRQLVAGSYPEEDGHLSPDGKMLLFGSGRSGKAQIWVANTDGANARQMTNFEAVDSVAAFWARNSKEAIISVRSSEQGEWIYRKSIAGPSPLIPILHGGFGTSMSRDGRWLYFVKSQGANRSLWRTPYPGAETAELLVEGGAFGLESTDGRTLYFAKRDEDDGLWRQSLPHGPATQLVRRLYWRSLFAVGKLGYYYVSREEGAALPSLFFQSLQQDQPRRLLSFDRALGLGLDLSADEQTLLYTQQDILNSDILMIERFH